MFLVESRFAKNLLLDSGMKNCKPVTTPATPYMKLSKEMCPTTIQDQTAVENEEKKLNYRSVVSSLLWLLHTRPDISFAVSEVSRYVMNPGPMHYMALKRILRYLKGTVDYGLLYVRSGSPIITLSGCVDSDWAGNIDNRRSTTGYLVKLNENIIAGKSKVQTCTALSSCEAETVALGQAAQELMSLRSILHELGYSQESPTLLNCDNTGAIAFSKDGGNHSKMKHISLREHFLRDLVREKQIRPEYIATADNPADLFTKALGPVKFREHRDRLKIVSRP